MHPNTFMVMGGGKKYILILFPALLSFTLKTFNFLIDRNHYREYWRSRKTFILIGLVVLIVCFLSNGSLKDSSSELKELLVGSSMSNPLLIKHIQTVMRPPSGKEPVLEKPDEVKSAMGQTGQVQAILDHFKNKVTIHASRLSGPNDFISKDIIHHIF